MGRRTGVEKKNALTLGTERCENIKNLYMNKNGNRENDKLDDE